MSEYFVVANSFAAPFVSDQSTHFIKGKDPKSALEEFAKKYDHPAGLYCAVIYSSSDDYHKGKKPLANWYSNHLIKLKSLDVRSYCGHGPGNFDVNGERHIVENPKEGKVL